MITPLDVLAALSRTPDDPTGALSLWDGVPLPLTAEGRADASDLLVPLLGILHAAVGHAAATTGCTRAAVIDTLREEFIEIEARRL